MDGILISSLGSVERSWTRWARMCGVTPSTLRPDLDSAAQLKVIEKIELANGEGLALFASGYLPYPDAFQEEDRQRAGLVDGRGLDLVALFQ
jgi:sugar-phosphatase